MITGKITPKGKRHIITISTSTKRAEPICNSRVFTIGDPAEYFVDFMPNGTKDDVDCKKCRHALVIHYWYYGSMED